MKQYNNLPGYLAQSEYFYQPLIIYLVSLHSLRWNLLILIKMLYSLFLSYLKQVTWQGWERIVSINWNKSSDELGSWISSCYKSMSVYIGLSATGYILLTHSRMSCSVTLCSGSIHSNVWRIRINHPGPIFGLCDCINN